MCKFTSYCKSTYLHTHNLKMNALLSAVVLVVAMASATVSGLSLGAGPMKKVAVFGGTGVSDKFGLMTALFDVS